MIDNKSADLGFSILILLLILVLAYKCFTHNPDNIKTLSYIGKDVSKQVTAIGKDVKKISDDPEIKKHSKDLIKIGKKIDKNATENTFGATKEINKSIDKTVKNLKVAAKNETDKGETKTAKLLNKAVTSLEKEKKKINQKPNIVDKAANVIVENFRSNTSLDDKSYMDDMDSDDTISDMDKFKDIDEISGIGDDSDMNRLSGDSDMDRLSGDSDMDRLSEDQNEVLKFKDKKRNIYNKYNDILSDISI